MVAHSRHLVWFDVQKGSANKELWTAHVAPQLASDELSGTVQRETMREM